MTKKLKLKSTKEKASYSIGLTTAAYLNRDMDIGTIKDDLNLDIFFEGIRDGVEGTKAKLTREEIEEALNAFREKMEKRQKAAQQENNEAGVKFLEENAKREEIIVTDSGMQYEIISDGGTESIPGLNDQVKVHYRGTLIDGTEFDSSYSRGEPAVFSPTQVIKGWTEALTMMNVGSEWKVYLPSELAYGERGAPPSIGPGEVLIFTIKLEEIVS